MSKALEYNLAESKRVGWGPEILALKKIDEQFVETVKLFQKQNGLTIDGMLGPHTYRVIQTVRKYSNNYKETTVDIESTNRIICNGKDVELKNAKCVTWKDKGGLTLQGGYSSETNRNIKHFVTHWDATLSSKMCKDILQKRGLSVHFMIDNDGTIYQLLDTSVKAYHAGDANSSSIGVEVSNAYYTRFQDWYVKNGFGKRPITLPVKGHGSTIEPHLDFYDAQYEALSSLWEAIHRAHGIPLVIPTKLDGVIDWRNFKGFMNHFHITSGKIDCFGIDHQRVLNKSLELSKIETKAQKISKSSKKQSVIITEEEEKSVDLNIGCGSDDLG